MLLIDRSPDIFSSNASQDGKPKRDASRDRGKKFPLSIFRMRTFAMETRLQPAGSLQAACRLLAGCLQALHAACRHCTLLAGCLQAACRLLAGCLQRACSVLAACLQRACNVLRAPKDALPSLQAACRNPACRLPAGSLLAGCLHAAAGCLQEACLQAACTLFFEFFRFSDFSCFLQGFCIRFGIRGDFCEFRHYINKRNKTSPNMHIF